MCIFPCFWKWLMGFCDQQKSWPVPLSQPSNFIKCELPFLHGLKSHTHIGYCAVNHVVTTLHKIMTKHSTKSEGTITHLYMWQSIWLPPHSINTGVKKRPDSPSKILWWYLCWLNWYYTSVYIIMRKYVVKVTCAVQDETIWRYIITHLPYVTVKMAAAAII